MSDLVPSEIARPDAGSARVVQQTIAHLAGRELELSQSFYGHLFAMLPEVRALFPDDMAEQRVRLLKALLASVGSLDDPEGMESRLQALGEIHYYRGIADDQYQYVGHALVRAVRDVVQGDWSTWLSSAWISVYSWMIQHMVVGARRARAAVEAGAPGASLEDAQRLYLQVQVRSGAGPLLPPEPDGGVAAAGAHGYGHVPAGYGVAPYRAAGYSLAEYPGTEHVPAAYPQGSAYPPPGEYAWAPRSVQRHAARGRIPTQDPTLERQEVGDPVGVPAAGADMSWFGTPGRSESAPTVLPRQPPGAGHF